MAEALSARLAALEARLAALEDEAAITRLIATYGPAVDSLTNAPLADLWTEDAVYDTGAQVFVGREAIAALTGVETHRAFVEKGCAHVLSLPLITVDGDRAVAINHSRVYVREGEGWIVARASANCWDLVRTPAGWRVARRVNRLLNGSAEARALLVPGMPPD